LEYLKNVTRCTGEEPVCLFAGVPTLETERLRLRPFRPSDFTDYSAMYADPEVLRYLVGSGGRPWARDRSWRHMAFLQGHWQLAGSGSWAVEHKASGAFVGVIGFSEPEGWPGLELAWTLARRWWGFGYATEGARAALAFAFTRWKRERVISLISPDNQRSIRVAERLGESLQGRISHNGVEMLCYGIDRPSYAAKGGNRAFMSEAPALEAASQACLSRG
jgi:RimJ/RimL family protein N-acetyltransferase